MSKPTWAHSGRSEGLNLTAMDHKSAITCFAKKKKKLVYFLATVFPLHYSNKIFLVNHAII